METRSLTRRRPKVFTKNVTTTASIESIDGVDILTQIAYLFFAIIEGLLIAQIILRAYVVNSLNPWVTWLYTTTTFITLPITSIFPMLGSSLMGVVITTLLSIILYLVIFYVAIAVFRAFVDQEQVINPEGKYHARIKKATSNK